MDRREVLKWGSAIGVTAVAGCTEAEPGRDATSGDETDSDGDGVPDEHDYAPRDPDVQSKQDTLGRVTPTPPQTPTSHRTPSPSLRPTLNLDDLEIAESATPTPSDISISSPSDTEDFNLSEIIDDEFQQGSQTSSGGEQVPTNSILADSSYLLGRTSHFTRYSLQSATLDIVSETIDRVYFGNAKLIISITSYPDDILTRDRVYGHGMSDSFNPSDNPTVTVELQVDTVPSNGFHMVAFLVDDTVTFDTLGAADTEHLCETNRLAVSNGRLVVDESNHALDDTEQNVFSRTSAEGCYVLEFSGSIDWDSWTASMLAFKSQYVRSSTAIQQRDYAGYVRRAQERGLADTLADILDGEARNNGYETTRERVEFIIDFVQNLPYVPDDVSTGYDDYTKPVAETLTEGGGDCEDSAILMAALLQATPFNYDCILIEPPGHMAVGVYGEDLPGTYWEYEGRRYYYLETTGDGWDVGEIPDDYRGESARLWQV